MALGVILILAGCTAGRKPVVGISSSWDDARVVSLNDTYVAAVRAAGGVPVVLPPVRSASEAAEVLSLVDAVIFSGGEDVDPSRYGEDVLNSTVEVNAPRDTSDFLLASEALQRGMPVLGICRGSQLLNVLFGGSLYQDLPGQIGSLSGDGGCVLDSSGRAAHGSFLNGLERGGSEVNGTAAAVRQGHSAIHHRQSEAGSVGTHWIYIEKDSRLHGLLGLDSVKVNSFHHQAVKEPGTGVHVVATAPDGVVEAWEWNAPHRDGILCVQFHPEIFVKAGDTSFLPLFQDLIDRAR